MNKTTSVLNKAARKLAARESLALNITHIIILYMLVLVRSTLSVRGLYIYVVIKATIV